MKSILSFTFLLLTCSAMAQNGDTLLYERFETGGASFMLNTADEGGVSAAVGYNQWIINNEYTGGTGQLVCSGFPTTFTVPNTPMQPIAIAGGATTQYMHMISDAGQAAGILNCSYLAANGLCGNGEYYFSKMAQDVTTIGYDSVTVSFLWICAGANNIYGELYYSNDAGTSWNLVTVPTSQFSGQTNWVMHSVSIPAFSSQATLRFGFRFVNEIAFSANDPGFAVDEFMITAKTASPPPVAAFSVSDTAICAGSCVNYTDMSSNDPVSWFWVFQGSSTSFSSQQNPQSICYTTPGIYPVTLIVENASGSDTLTLSTITVFANPSSPVITASADTLFATPGFDAYQWYLDNVIIPGATGDTLLALANGNYTVTATDTNGCSATSTIFLLNTALAENSNAVLELYPNPSTGIVTMTINSPLTEIKISDISGRTVHQMENVNSGKIDIDLTPVGNGLYFVKSTGKNGTVCYSRLLKQ